MDFNTGVPTELCVRVLFMHKLQTDIVKLVGEPLFYRRYKIEYVCKGIFWSKGLCKCFENVKVENGLRNVVMFI